jgi:hypothetical protein
MVFLKKRYFILLHIFYKYFMIERDKKKSEWKRMKYLKNLCVLGIVVLLFVFSHTFTHVFASQSTCQQSGGVWKESKDCPQFEDASQIPEEKRTCTLNVSCVCPSGFDARPCDDACIPSTMGLNTLSPNSDDAVAEDVLKFQQISEKECNKIRDTQYQPFDIITHEVNSQTGKDRKVNTESEGVCECKSGLFYSPADKACKSIDRNFLCSYTCGTPEGSSCRCMKGSQWDSRLGCVSPKFGLGSTMIFGENAKWTVLFIVGFFTLGLTGIFLTSRKKRKT